MKNILIIIILIFLSISLSNYIVGQQKSPTNLSQKTDTLTPVLPVDSSLFYVKIRGKYNIVKVNGKIMTSTADSSRNNSKNKIYVAGEGNSVSVTQSTNNSEMIITQKGGNNKVIILQNK